MKIKKAILNSILLLLPVGLCAETFWAEGVSKEGGWYDVKKQWNDEDSNLCWAASAANLLQYWQSAYQNSGLSFPVKETPSTVDDIFNYFKANWENKGGETMQGIAWYLTGEFVGGTLPSNHANLEHGGTGGFFQTNVYPNARSLMFIETENWTQAGDMTYWSYNNNWEHEKFHGIDQFSKLITDYFSNKKSAISLGITGGPNAHAITCWGCETDDDGKVTKIYVTDSDLEESHLAGVPVSASINGSIQIDDYMGCGTRRIVDFTTLSIGRFSPIPEPSLFGLFSGILALGFLFVRRRRSR